MGNDVCKKRFKNLIIIFYKLCFETFIKRVADGFWFYNHYYI